MRRARPDLWHRVCLIIRTPSPSLPFGLHAVRCIRPHRGANGRPPAERWATGRAAERSDNRMTTPALLRDLLSSTSLVLYGAPPPSPKTLSSEVLSFHAVGMPYPHFSTSVAIGPASRHSDPFNGIPNATRLQFRFGPEEQIGAVKEQISRCGEGGRQCENPASGRRLTGVFGRGSY